MKRLVCVALAAAAPALAQEVAPGDQVVVTLDSGATFRGTLVGRDARSVTIKSAAGTIRALPVSSVSQVAKEVAPAPAAAAPSAAESPPAAASPTPAAPSAAPAAAPAAAAPLPIGARASQPPAQPAAAGHPVRIGLGVALPAAGEFPSFYLPIQVNQGLRVEPELGLVRFDVGSSSATALQIGLGLLGTSSVAPQVGAYGGLRLQIQRLDVSQGGGATNVRVAGVLGGEWQPVPQVAIGVEAQVAYVSLDRSITSGASAAGDANGLTTAGLLFFRVFLN